MGRNLELILIGIDCGEEDAFELSLAILLNLRNGPLEGFLEKVLDNLSESRVKNIFALCLKAVKNEIINNCLTLICGMLAVDDKWTEVFEFFKKKRRSKLFLDIHRLWHLRLSPRNPQYPARCRNQKTNLLCTFQLSRLRSKYYGQSP